MIDFSKGPRPPMPLWRIGAIMKDPTYGRHREGAVPRGGGGVHMIYIYITLVKKL